MSDFRCDPPWGERRADRLVCLSCRCLRFCPCHLGRLLFGRHR